MKCKTAISIIKILSIVLIAISCQLNKTHLLNPTDAISFSQEFILQQKSGKSTSAFIDTLKNLDNTKLIADLNSDEKKIAFWINCYNALVIHQLSIDTNSYKNKSNFFDASNISIGGEKISLNDIENGILRLKKIKKNESFIAQFRPKKIDCRIHFTLNCGANSCPPIAYYSPNELEEQLSAAEKSFVKSTSVYHSEKNEVAISELFKWYEKDFNSEKGILELLKRLQIIPVWANPTITYTPYDWSIATK